MQRTKAVIVALSVSIAIPAHAQFGSLFQNVVESAAKQAVQQGAQQGVQQGVTQAVIGTTAQPVAPVATGPTMVNGCYFNLPAPPPGVVLNPDSNGNGCVDQNETNAYVYAVQAAYNAAQARGAAVAAPSNSTALGSVVGSAMAVKNAGGTGNAAAWVAGQNALGAAANAARAQPVQPQVVAANPVDLNGDGIVTAEEVAAHQTRVTAAGSMVAQPPVQGAQNVVSNTTSEVVSGAVSGALKGLFGH
jgi:hypothetical protein